MGANAVGFVFAPSVRQITAERASDIAKRLPREILTVAVFRDEAPKRVVHIMNKYGFGAAQLHGHESVEDTAYVLERVPRVIKAFVAGSPQLARAKDWGCPMILIDAPKPGSGKSYDYGLANSRPQGLTAILAGGLTAGNVAAAAAETNVFGVDVSSGVESKPGHKDVKAILSFIRSARTQ